MRESLSPSIRLSLRRLALGMIIPLWFAGCSGGGGLDWADEAPPPRELPPVVAVEDAPIIGAVVQDRAGGDRAQTALPSSTPGRYVFNATPTLPLKISSPNLIGPDGKVRVGQIQGRWVSWIDSNGNGILDADDEERTLAFQDLDGNGLYTQSVDIVFNGQFIVHYVPPAQSNVIQANIVASLIPATWDGVSPVAGLSASTLNESTSRGPTQSTDPQLKRVTAVLTAVSEGLLSTLTSTGSGVTQAQAAIERALSALSAAGSGVDLTKSDASSVAKVAQIVAQSLPTQNQGSATNLVTNVSSVSNSSGLSNTSNFEAVVKVTQDRLTEMISSLSSTGQQDLNQDAALSANAIQTAKQDAVPNVDPDAVRIANLRLIPLGYPDPGSVVSSAGAILQNEWVDLSTTSSFSAQRQPDGSLRIKVSGGPFQTVLGGTQRDIPFLSASNSWVYKGSSNESLKIRVGVSVPRFNLAGGIDTGAFAEVSVIQLCSAQGVCVYYFLADSTQLCNPVSVWSNLVSTWPGDVTLPGKQKFLTALNRVNATATSCP